MGLEGWYYMHENGEMIYKRELGGTAADIRESTFAKMPWPFDPDDRAGAWHIVVDGLACGQTRAVLRIWQINGVVTTKMQ